MNAKISILFVALTIWVALPRVASAVSPDLLRARTLLRSGHAADARKIVDAQPSGALESDLNSSLITASVYASTGEKARAEQCLMKAHESASGPQRDYLDQLIGAIHEQIQLNGLTIRADAALKKRQFRQAADLYQAAYHLAPFRPDLELACAAASVRAGDYAKAANTLGTLREHADPERAKHLDKVRALLVAASTSQPTRTLARRGAAIGPASNASGPRAQSHTKTDQNALAREFYKQLK